MFYFLGNMYPTCNLADPEICNLGGFLLSGIYDNLLCNLGHLNKCVDGHGVATLASSPLLTWSFFRLNKGYEC